MPLLTHRMLVLTLLTWPLAFAYRRGLVRRLRPLLISSMKWAGSLVHPTKVNPSNVWLKHLRRPGCQNPFKFALKIRLMDEGLCSGNQTSSPQAQGVRDRYHHDRDVRKTGVDESGQSEAVG